MKKNNNSINYNSEYDQLVYVRLFEGCNLFCKHCFIPANPKRMTVQQCLSIPEICKTFSKPKEKILLQFHGGEPTLFGARRLETVLDSLSESELDFSFGIQTNLMNYNSDWGRLYKKYFNGRIGVSWDYNIRFKDKNNAKSNKDFDDVFWNNLKLLKEHGVEPYIIITGTKLFFEWVVYNAFEFFDKLLEHGVKGFHVEKLSKTGNAREYWGEIGVSNMEYSEYMSMLYCLYDNWLNSRCLSLGFSPLNDIENDLLKLLRGERTCGSGCLSGKCDSRFHTIDSNGYKFGCSALNSEYDNVSSKVEGIQIFTPEELGDIRISRVEKCGDCEFTSICNTGCVASVVFDISGECNGGRELFKTVKKNIMKKNKL